MDTELAIYKVFNVRKLSLGLTYRDTENSISLLLVILSEQDKFRDTKTFLENLQTYHVEDLEAIYSKALKTDTRVIDILAQQKRLDEIIELYESLIQQYEKIFESNDYSIMTIMRKLAYLQYRHNKISITKSL